MGNCPVVSREHFSLVVTHQKDLNRGGGLEGKVEREPEKITLRTFRKCPMETQECRKSKQYDSHMEGLGTPTWPLGNASYMSERNVLQLPM